MCDPQTPGARTTHGGLAMASPYTIDKVNRTTSGPAFTRRGRTCATRKPAAPA